MTLFLSFFLFERTTAPNQNGARRTRSRTAAMHCQTCLLLMTKTSKSNSGSSVANNSFQSSTWRTPLLLLTYELVHGICIRTRTRTRARAHTHILLPPEVLLVPPEVLFIIFLLPKKCFFVYFVDTILLTTFPNADAFFPLIDMINVSP